MATINIKGDPRMAAAIAEGANAVALRDLQERYDKLQARYGVRLYGDDKRWERTRRRLARKYRIEPVGRVKGAILGVWGLCILGVDAAYKRLAAWNRS